MSKAYNYLVLSNLLSNSSYVGIYFILLRLSVPNLT